MRTNLLRPYVADWHGHVPSRYATDPREELMRMENHSRYTAQSANSRDGEVAELPARERLTTAQRYAAEQSPGMDYDTELADGFSLKYGAACGAD